MRLSISDDVSAVIKHPTNTVNANNHNKVIRGLINKLTIINRKDEIRNKKSGGRNNTEP